MTAMPPPAPSRAERRCEWCKGAFAVPPRSGPRPRFCSRACRGRAKYARLNPRSDALVAALVGAESKASARPVAYAVVYDVTSAYEDVTP